jgi:hypothetical protein
LWCSRRGRKTGRNLPRPTSSCPSLPLQRSSLKLCCLSCTVTNAGNGTVWKKQDSEESIWLLSVVPLQDYVAPWSPITHEERRRNVTPGAQAKWQRTQFRF